VDVHRFRGTVILTVIVHGRDARATQLQLNLSIPRRGRGYRESATSAKYLHKKREY